MKIKVLSSILILTSFVVWAAGGFKDFSVDELRFGGSPSGVRKIIFDQSPDGSSAEISVDPADEEVSVNNKLNASSGLGVTGRFDVSSTTESSQPCPVMTEAQRDAIASPVNGDCIYNSDSKSLNTYDSSVSAWVTVGSGAGGGSESLITGDNSNFENSVGDWVSYDDPAGSRPDDGTGAGATTTCTQQSGTSLFGGAFFRISKDGVNRQGEGCALDFDPDEGYQTNRLLITFDYTTSANYQDNDLTDATTDTDVVICIYDKTNASLIQDSCVDLPGGTKRPFVSSFSVPHNSTSLRVTAHVSTNNASAYNVDIDNFKISPMSTTQITPVTDTFDCTPSSTSITNGSFTHQESKCRIVGDQMTITSSYEASGAATGNLELTDAQLLPAGYDVDTAKIDSASATPRGAYFAFDSSAASTANDFTGIAQVLSNGNIRFYTDSDDNVGINTPFTWASGDFFTFTITVPIKGYSGNVSIGEIKSQRGIYAQYKTDTVGSYASGDSLIFEDLKWDNANIYNTSTGIVTLPESGRYQLNVTIATANITASSADRGIYIEASQTGSKTENYRGELSMSSNTTARNYSAVLSVDIEGSKGDQIDIKVAYDIAVGPISLSGNADQNHFSLHKIQEPHANAPLEKVRVSVTESSALSITAATPFVYGDKITDNFGAYNPSTGIFTSPRATYCDVTASILSASVAWSANDTISMEIQKNGTGVAIDQIRIWAASTSTNAASIDAKSIYLNKGDTLEVDISASQTVNSNTIPKWNRLEIVCD